MIRRTAVLVLALAAGCVGARAAHEYVYSPTKREFVSLRGGKKEALRAGRWQQVSIGYPTPMESVFGRIGEMAVPFQSDSEGRNWVAAFDVPQYEALGYEKVMRVYAQAASGSAIGADEPEFQAIPISR